MRISTERVESLNKAALRAVDQTAASEADFEGHKASLVEGHRQFVAARKHHQECLDVLQKAQAEYMGLVAKLQSQTGGQQLAANVLQIMGFTSMADLPEDAQI